METTIYIAVGSNIDPEENVVEALRLLQAELCVTASSTFYWSAALDRPAQAPFLNGVWQAQTTRAPREIKFELLRPLEHRLGRRRAADRHAARPIDLDLVMHGATRLLEPDLQLPDPDIPKRAFLWQPLSEFAGVQLDTFGLLPTPQALECLDSDPRITERLRQALTSPPKAER